MPTPPWMNPETPPQPARGSGQIPRVLDQRPSGDGAVLVTVALPGLNSAVIRVPEYAWVAGEHHLIQGALADAHASMLPAGTLPPDPANEAG